MGARCSEPQRCGDSECCKAPGSCPPTAVTSAVTSACPSAFPSSRGGPHERFKNTVAYQLKMRERQRRENTDTTDGRETTGLTDITEADTVANRTESPGFRENG